MSYRMRILFILILSLLFCNRSERVSEVIDGDTFRTEKGETVRLLGINTPEMGEPGADIAKNFLKLMVQDKEVRLEKDVTDRDDFGRLLRYVFVEEIPVNAELVRMGLAEVRFYPPDTAYKKEFEFLEKRAVQVNRGLWAFPVFQLPDTLGGIPEEKHKEEEVEDVISWLDAAKYYGQIKTVEGKIVLTNNTGKVCFLNFHADWKRYFTAVIFAGDFDKFPRHPEDYYLNKRVRVRGLIKKYRDKPEIILKSPEQIKVIE
ncbi:MAG TPA: thermonuclease family protein [candidate division WOR-3 bacterium]|uniref:Thermonuclease family protein n=1 Tax=candidate division WOR-3 bacterium TaxID=2052148 RepID=A0A9C9EK91_UNCW3|nr:thermonuclease family protein [candidate division WOR-3 bacterium]